MASRTSTARLVACLVIVLGSALVPASVASAAGTPPTPHTDGTSVASKHATVAKTVSVAASSKKAAAMSAGYAHNCLVTTKGKLQCWGYNVSGQVGDGTTTNVLAPVTVSGLSKGTKAVAPGYYHTCALTTKGKAKCWGYNGYGALGNNTTANSLVPVTVYGLSKGVKAISASYLHTCALTTKGKVLCWGDNTYGQLGDNTTTNSLKPVTVYGLSKGVKAISAGYTTTCATTTKGKAKCWGDNTYGQLGNGTTTSSPKPVTVSGLSKGVKATKPGVLHTCALTTKGKVLCWGNNAYGELGDNSTTNSTTPVAVYNLDKSTKVSLGYIHTCALTAKKAIKCWGNNSVGQLGDNTTTGSPMPVKVYGF